MHPASADPYAEALAYLYGRINYELTATLPYRARELNLDRMRELLDRLGNPHRHPAIVHVAGTKGKGSTAAMISAIGQAAGYRVGLYTSPHLTRLEERLAIDGQPCSPSELVELTAQVRHVAGEADSSGPLEGTRWTFFDITTAMAFLYFQQRQVELIVLEVGMGGRLDSTNVCQPLVSVITSISFDHTKQLGTTLAAIAGEKAGIIKPGIPVVSGVVEAEPAEVIARIAQERVAPLYQRGREFSATYQPSDASGPGTISYREAVGERAWQLEGIQLGLLGAHQGMNAGVALATVNRLRELGWQITEQHCREGLGSARCPARIEVVSRQPTIVVDTAHNDASVRALTATLGEAFVSHHRVLLFAVARDKDVPGMLRHLLPHFQEVILTQFTTNPRALPVAELAAMTRQVLEASPLPPVTVHLAATPHEAWERWQQVAHPDSLLCIAGSFFLAADLSGDLAAWRGLSRPAPSLTP